MSAAESNGKAPTWPMLAKGLWAIVTALLLILYNDARGDIGRLNERVDALQSMVERLGRLEERVTAIDARTLRIENKLDAALDRQPYVGRPGPR